MANVLLIAGTLVVWILWNLRGTGLLPAFAIIGGIIAIFSASVFFAGYGFTKVFALIPQNLIAVGMGALIVAGTCWVLVKLMKDLVVMLRAP